MKFGIFFCDFGLQLGSLLAPKMPPSPPRMGPRGVKIEDKKNGFLRIRAGSPSGVVFGWMFNDFGDDFGRILEGFLKGFERFSEAFWKDFERIWVLVPIANPMFPQR